MATRQHDPFIDADDRINNDSGNGHIGALVDARLSRREVLVGGIGTGAAMVMGSLPLVGCGNDDDSNGLPAPKLGFTAISRSTDDKVKLPAGYSFHVLVAMGDPVDDIQAPWSGNGSETPESFEKRSGDHHDAIAWFGLSDAGKWQENNSQRGLLVTNHEALTTVYLHAADDNGESVRSGAQVLKEINAHGVSVIQIDKASGTFQVNRKSSFNRRITAQTPAVLTGPVAGTSRVKTRYDANGIQCRGTLNNCAHGVTPWGTYLACEENWAGYFGRAARDDAVRTAAEVALLNRYGIRQGSPGRHKWHTVAGGDAVPDTNQRFSRWNASVTGASTDGTDDYRNEPNTMGWVVEIDPFATTSTPRKRTCLGRIAHEGAWFAPAVKGKPLVVYTGDDSRNEYIYKFVSTAAWDPADINTGLAAGDKYLDDGKLYVAKFGSDGKGQWMLLAQGQNGLLSTSTPFPFSNQSDVLVATRLAADAVGATKMDRPEWGGVNPLNGEVYMTLTNNSQRSGRQDAANPRAYDADTGSCTSSQDGNVNGHIIRWREDGNDHAATSFAWDIYVFAARKAYPANVNLSALDDTNDMSSPDGLWFDPRGILWIQTDDGAYTKAVAGDSTITNCMMLAAVPGKVGDGAHYDVAKPEGTVRTYIGQAPGTRLRRFLVGPKQCEITGVCMTPDNRAMFVNIQHPGEDGDLIDMPSHWPDIETNPASTARPRSATIVITRNDGGEIGT